MATKTSVPKMSEKKSYTDGMDLEAHAKMLLEAFKKDPDSVFNVMGQEPAAFQEYIPGVNEEVEKIADYQQKYPTFGKEVGHVLGKTAEYATLGYVGGAGSCVGLCVAFDHILSASVSSKLRSDVPYSASASVGIVGLLGAGAVGCWKGISDLSEDRKKTDYANLAKTYLASAKKTGA
jgi:hypothetical protein